MSDPTWIAVLPPALAIVLAITSRQVYLSLAGGLWLGWTILHGWNPIAGMGAAIQGTVEVFQDEGDTRAILFTLIVGALIAARGLHGRGAVHGADGGEPDRARRLGRDRCR